MNASEGSHEARRAKTKLNVLTAVLTVIALIVIFWAAREILTQAGTGQLVLFTILALLTLPFCIYVPSTSSLVHFGETYLMALAITQGPSSCVIGTASYSLLLMLMGIRLLPPTLLLFSFSSMVCAACLCGRRA